MSSNYDQLSIKNDIKTKKRLLANQYSNNKSIKALNTALIIMIVILSIVYFSRIQVKDKTIEKLNKTIYLSALNDSICKLHNKVITFENELLSITDELQSTSVFKGILNKKLSSLKQLSQTLIEKKNTKQHYYTLSKSISTILTPDYFERIEQITNSKIISLCYRSSRDGLDPKVFHNKCDGLKPTVTLIQSQKNSVFGGFTHASWDGSEFKEDPKAFLFSPHKVFPIIEGKIAISAFPNLLPTFGEDDIVTTVARCYTRNQLKSYNSTWKSDNYFSSLYDAHDYFELKDLEVFHMKDKLESTIN